MTRAAPRTVACSARGQPSPRCPTRPPPPPPRARGSRAAAAAAAAAAGGACAARGRRPRRAAAVIEPGDEHDALSARAAAAVVVARAVARGARRRPRRARAGRARPCDRLELSTAAARSDHAAGDVVPCSSAASERPTGDCLEMTGSGARARPQSSGSRNNGGAKADGVISLDGREVWVVSDILKSLVSGHVFLGVPYLARLSARRSARPGCCCLRSSSRCSRASRRSALAPLGASAAAAPVAAAPATCEALVLRLFGGAAGPRGADTAGFDAAGVAAACAENVVWDDGLAAPVIGRGAVRAMLGAKFPRARGSCPSASPTASRRAASRGTARRSARRRGAGCAARRIPQRSKRAEASSLG